MDLIAGRDQNYEPTGRWKAERRARRHGPIRARYRAMDVLAALPGPRARNQQDSYDNAAHSHVESERQEAAHRRDVPAEGEDESQSCSGEKANPDESALPPLRHLRRHSWQR